VNDLEDRVRAHLHARLAAVDVAPGSPDAVRPARPRRWIVPTAAAASVALVVAGAVGAWSTRGDDDDGDDPGDAVVVTDDPETSTTVGVTVDTPVPTTVPAPSHPGIAIAPSSPVWSPADAMPVIIGHGDGFVAIVQTGGATTLRSSDDGTTWYETAVDIGGAVVRRLVSDGDVLLATGSLDDEPWAATSADDGRTWSRVALGLPDLTQPEWTQRWTDVSGAARVAGGFVLVGAITDRADLAALMLAQTGIDMATFDGYGESWSGTTAEIDPGGDAEPITLDVSGLDPSVRDPYGRLTTVVWRVDGDGTASEPSVDPFGAGRGAQVVVSGPLGAAVLSSTDQGRGPSWMEASSDGVTWTEVPLPEGLTNQRLSAGSTGYVLTDQDGRAMWRSDDLGTWTAVEPGLPDVGAMWSIAASGPAGFVAVARPSVPAEEPEGPIVVDSDGRRLTVDEAAGLTTVVDIATGEELLRWEGDVSAPPAGVMTVEDDELRYADPETGEVVFQAALAEVMRAMSARQGMPEPSDVLVRWSADGITWDEVPVPDGTVSLLAAVSDDRVLVMPLSLEGSVVEDVVTR
jgi:hypothetical protein